MPQANVLAVPDLHIPYQHPDALSFVQLVDQLWFPSKNRAVVFLGDEIDAHNIGSRHMPDPNGRSPGDELEDAKRILGDWYRAYPVAKLCTSNHTMRPWKRAFEAGLPKQFMRDVREVLKAPTAWEWADRHVIHDIVFEHGENVSGPLGALNAAVQNRRSTVIGHLHTFGGVVHSDSYADKIWGLNAGCLIASEMLAFAYAKTIRKRPTVGCGVIKNGSPYFIPMLLNAEARWIGAV